MLVIFGRQRSFLAFIFSKNIFFTIYQSILSKTLNSIEMKRDIHCPFYQFLDFEYTIITIARS